MYFLEEKRPYSMPNVLGNCSQPVKTYRWVQIAACEEKEPLEMMLPANFKDRQRYRIEGYGGQNETDTHH